MKEAYLNALGITQWVRRPISSAAAGVGFWIALKRGVILIEIESTQAAFLEEQEQLCQAIFKAFNIPENTKREALILNRFSETLQDLQPQIVWVWGRFTKQLFPSAQRLETSQLQHYSVPDKPYTIVESVSLANMLKNPGKKRIFWQEGLFIQKHMQVDFL